MSLRTQSWFGVALCLAGFFSAAAHAIDGDFNGDGAWDCEDLNALSQAIVSGSVDQLYDLNGDGVVSMEDILAPGTGWLAIGGSQNSLLTGGNPFLFGDANLDGVVDGSDFNDWNANKLSGLDLYCAGDFNVDGNIDQTDLQIWNANAFTASLGSPVAEVATVPEPVISGGILLLLAAIVLRARK